MPSSTTITVPLRPTPPPAAAPVISVELAEAILNAVDRRVTSTRNRLGAVARNYPGRMRRAGLGPLADNLEQAVADVVGHDGDPGRPGSLHRLTDEVRGLIDAAVRV
jgi:hypothetical protein